jgi:hypothetical protein
VVVVSPLDPLAVTATVASAFERLGVRYRDVLGVLEAQGSATDRDELRTWAAHTGVADLLDRALRESDVA